jgi:hypothetical protein
LGPPIDIDISFAGGWSHQTIGYSKTSESVPIALTRVPFVPHVV